MKIKIVSNVKNAGGAPRLCPWMIEYPVERKN